MRTTASLSPLVARHEHGVSLISVRATFGRNAEQLYTPGMLIGTGSDRALGTPSVFSAVAAT